MLDCEGVGCEETEECKVRQLSSPHGLVKVWLDRAGVEVAVAVVEVTPTNTDLARGTKTRNTRI